MKRLLLHVLCIYLSLFTFGCENDRESMNCSSSDCSSSGYTDFIQVIDKDSASDTLNCILEDLTETTRVGDSGYIYTDFSLISVSDFVEPKFSDVVLGFNNQFYLVNYIDPNQNKGCAFLSATLNLPPVIAIYNNDWFSIEDCKKAWNYICSTNDTLIMYQDTSTRSINGDPIIDPLLPPTVPPISLIISTPTIPPENPNVRIHDGWEDGAKIGPLLKSHFHQNSPYNDKYDWYIDEDEVPDADENTRRDTIEYYAGCSIIALAQIVAHNKIYRDIGPSKIGKTTIDWMNINSAIEKQNIVHQGLSNITDALKFK